MSSSVFERLRTALAGRYRVERELGAGGMATVYLAHDEKHERDVAIKVLHPDLGAALGAERFLSEIKTTAKLQHPHILPLLDSGAADGLLYYVMPYVRGETLRARLERERQLPIADAVRLAREIASALDYAHRQGIIHRDIKPENVLLQDGSALVADFGIALAVQSAGGARMTQTGLSLGTPQYMSPEQAMGERTIDARSDLYALGAMCYEMLTGDPPFMGNTVQAIVAKVLSEKPVSPRTMRDTVPVHVEQAVLACLSKLPADRPGSAREFADSLGNAPTVTADVAVANGARIAAPHRAGSRRSILAMLGVTIAALAVAGWSLVRPRAATPDILPLQVSIDPGVSADGVRRVGGYTLSPNGQRLAFTVTDSSGQSLLYVRELDSASARVVPGTEGATFPTWSPDSRQVAFFAERELRRVEVNGGRPQRITDAEGSRYGANWVRDDLIVYTSSASPLLLAVAPSGGTPRVLVPGDTVRAVHTGVAAFDDGEHLLVRSFVASDSGSPSKFMLVRLSASSATVVREIASLQAVSRVGRSVIPRGDRYLIIDDGDVLVANYDPSSFEMVGDPVPLVVGGQVSRLSASRNDRLAYERRTGGAPNRLLVLDRAGATVRQLGPRADGAGYDYFGARFSRDAQSVFYEYHSGRGTGDLYRVSVRDGRIVRQTLDESHHNAFVAVAPDGRVVFSSTRNGADLFVKTPDGAPEQRLPISTPVGFPSDWSPDGKWILFSQTGIGGDILRATPSGDSVGPVLNSPVSELHAVFSPDGRWIAYTSDQQGGRFEVYLRRWPVTNEQWMVSSEGGEAPRWRGDGRELYYLRYAPGERDAQVRAVAVDLSGPAPAIGADTVLFTAAFRRGERNLRSSVNYDVSQDGTRFVGPVLETDGRVGVSSLHLFVNWPAALERRATSSARSGDGLTSP